MNRQDLDAIDRAISEEIAGSVSPPDSESADHPELQDLAVYVDGKLSGSDRERLEDHLADCADCRQIAMMSARAVRERDSETHKTEPRNELSRWRFWRPAFGLAAVLVATVTGFLWLRSDLPTDVTRLTEIGVPAAAVDVAGPELTRRAVAALAGEWQRPDGFEPFLAADRPVLRGASTTAAPVPIAPRWSVLDVDRPRFTWRFDLAVEEYEILVVDENEDLLAAFSIPAPAATGDVPSGDLSADYPVDAAALVPGQAGAWKVNARVAGEWVASPYVPFRRTTVEEEAQLEAELDRASGNPLLRAVAFGSWGRYQPTLRALGAVGEPHRGRLVGSILALQHFSAEDLDRERARWVGDPEMP